METEKTDENSYKKKTNSPPPPKNFNQAPHGLAETSIATRLFGSQPHPLKLLK